MPPLDDGHRQRLGLVAELTARDVRAEARKADVSDIDGWWAGGAGSRITGRVAAGFQTSAALGVQYLAASALAGGLALDPVAAVLDLTQLATSLRVTGPVAFKTNIATSRSRDAALQAMTVRLAGAAQRLALAGERETVARNIEASDVIIGYERVTAGGACEFCQMLAGRGAVYKTAATAGTVVGRRGKPRGNQRIGRSFHDHCRCTVRPIYADSTTGTRAADPAPVSDEERLAAEAAARREAGRAEAAAGNARRRARIEELRAEHHAGLDRLAEQRDDATSGRVDPDVLDRWGVTEEQFRNARVAVAEIKRDIRSVARAEADDLEGWLFDNDLAEINRPSALRQRTNMLTGARESVRDDAGWDWLEQLDDAEVRRVRERMVDGSPWSPDLIAEQVRRKTNLDLSDDEAMDWLVERWLHADGLKSLASGRIPKYANTENLIPAEYAEQGYSLDLLFGAADDDAAGHVAQVLADEGERVAGRILGDPRLGPAPWDMDAGDYAAELEYVEQVLASAETELGVLATEEYTWARQRVRELVPEDLDVDGAVNEYELHERIRLLAVTARRL